MTLRSTLKTAVAIAFAAGSLAIDPVVAQDAAKPAAVKAVPAKASPCKGLDETACKAKAGTTPGTCNWIAAKTTKDGKERKAFCRTVPACFGFQEAACKADKACDWTPAGKTPAGKNHPPYCKKKPKA